MVQTTPFLQALAVVAQAPPIVPYISSNTLAVRQVNTTDLPSQCQTTCQVINTISDCGSTLSCICVSSIGTQLQTCMNCLVAADPTVSIDANSAIESWNEACGGSLSLTSGSTSSSTATASSSTSTASSSSSNPFINKTGGAVNMKAATVAFGLVVAIACGIIIL
ncbi:hypothetical protein DEU56DRAFT_918662 [Suillus clintonianus]|uniref:uncharacterized protein n=1 Tax=Suillus clintonianus TaxID=1904413 RepID=UPI001B882E22|nr:uncharacterized protein DEU56DRAFT_918662 [Suillus clintonianus]KAG2119299.1 hypothetical protein DEU56DRAFT_918662 [Suillus clintonianus]